MKATIIHDSTRDENGQFKAGYRATIGFKYVNIEYLTNQQGDRDKVWRVKIEDFDSLKRGSMAADIDYITTTAEPRWQSRKIR